MTLRDIPADSLLRCFTGYLQMTEVPLSYQISGGLSILGALLRRSRWVDQVDWMVYPNQSVMFIGPSGIGKDTIINRCAATMSALEGVSKVPTIGGVTMELIHTRLAQLPAPATAYITAPEITAFFGKADYQANMLTGITNLLSGGSKVDISTKGSWLSQGGPTLIKEPTITMHAGSTVEWLHKGMPEGTLEGGFLGRFLLVVENLDARRRQRPRIKGSDLSAADIKYNKELLVEWIGGLKALVGKCAARGREMLLLDEAGWIYDNWYYNRFKIFSPAVQPYANRSRDTVLRLAMLMALSRGHDRWIDEEDMRFAVGVMTSLAQAIDQVVLPPSIEAQVAAKILDLLPATAGEIYATLGMRYSLPKQLDPALDLLRRTGKIVQGDRGIIRRTDET